MNINEIDLSSTNYVRNIREHISNKKPIREGIIAGELPFKVYELSQTQDFPTINAIRKLTVSSSEVAKILNVSRYSNPKEVLLYKLGYIEKTETLPTIVGREAEAVVANLYRYYPKGDLESSDKIFIHNYQNNLAVNKIEKETKTFVIEFIINFMDSVFVIVSPDYYDPEIMVPIDIKTINEFSFAKYDKEKENYDYTYQSLFQQIVYGSNIGHLFYLISNYSLNKKTVYYERYEKDIPVIVNLLYEFVKVLTYCRENELPFNTIVSTFYIEEGFDVTSVPEYKEWIEKLKSQDANEGEQEIQDQNESDKVNKMLQTYYELNMQKLEFEKECNKIKNVIKQLYIDKQKIKTDIIEVNLNPFRIKIREK